MISRVAIVGIDGSGKSALVEELRRRAPSASKVVALSCPNFHDTPDAPLARLSSQLKALSDLADELGSFELKLTALYLRMTLFGVVERFFVNTFAPAVLISDRHPLVETLVYLPLYQRKVTTGAGMPAESTVRRLLEACARGSYAAIRAWHDHENRRLQSQVEFSGVARDLIAEFDAPADVRMAMLERRYRTTLPDVVVMLDVEVQEAMRRTELRGAARMELHERGGALATLRDCYDVVLAELPELRPGLQVHRILTTGRTIDETLDDLIDLLGLSLPALGLDAPRPSP